MYTTHIYITHTQCPWRALLKGTQSPYHSVHYIIHIHRYAVESHEKSVWYIVLSILGLKLSIRMMKKRYAFSCFECGSLVLIKKKTVLTMG